MALSPPPPIQMSYDAPAVLIWRINDSDSYLEMPLSIDLCNTLEDQDVARIGEAVEARLKVLYPADKISRVLSWKPNGPTAEMLTVVQEAAPQEPPPEEQGQQPEPDPIP